MLRSTLRNLKHLGTAVLLLAVTVATAEVWLQCSQEPRPVVCGVRVDPADRQLLLPSQTSHHELRRLYTESRPPDGIAADFRTNSFGLRGPEPAVPKPAEVYRILVLGDDTVAGTHLPEQQTLSQRLQLLLSRHSGQSLEVINAGVPGYCPLLSLLQYRRELQQLQPDLVILHFDMSDVADDSAYRRALRSVDGQTLCCHPQLCSGQTSDQPLQRLLDRSALADYLRVNLSRLAQTETAASDGLASDRAAYLWTRPTPPDVRIQVQHALNPVSDLSNQLRTAGQQLMICTSPVYWQVLSPDVNSARSRRYGIVERTPVTRDLPFEILETFCEQSQILFCDATPAFREFSAKVGQAGQSVAMTADKLFETDSTRLSAYGTALYAREIAATLLNGAPERSPRSTARPSPEVY